MAYTLAIHKKGYETFNIKNYSEILLDENYDETSLKNIVNFIHEYDSEEELVEYLWQCGILPINYKDGTIAIRKYTKKKPEDIKTLDYGVSYHGDEKYYSTSFLISYYSNIYDPVRMNTLKSLSDTFSYKFKAIIEELEQRNTKDTKIRKYENLRMILSNIYYLADMAEKGFISGEEELELRRKIGEFFTKYCTHQKQNKYEESFPELRNVAMFTIDYERKHLRTPARNKFKDKEAIDKLSKTLKYYLNLLNDPNLSEEQRDAYNLYIDEIETKITELSSKDYTRTRGVNNEFTEY